ncbi:MAG: c-type cytochrome [Verrucomicrobia bacterium]|nr:c-type cytochrome [Verrucomicrobiota bacterium]MDA1087509.1 c-type cytochrome [Verrucomicrobiota bacterium]
MNTRDRILPIAATALSCLVVGFALCPVDRAALPDLARFAGRLHPLAVHLPIGVFAALLVLELVGLRHKVAPLVPACVILVWLFAATAVPTAIFGILLAPSGAYEDEVLFRHRWLGCATAVLGLGLLVLRNLHLIGGARRALTAYRVLLVVVAVVVTAAGHYGGSLTHGAGYLARYAPGFLRASAVSDRSPTIAAVSNGDQANAVFARSVQPVLEQYCYRCHGAERQKKDLRLDILDPDLTDGPDVETWRKALEKVSAEEMPPENKPQPSDAERQAVLAWLTDFLPPEDTL